MIPHDKKTLAKGLGLALLFIFPVTWLYTCAGREDDALVSASASESDLPKTQKTSVGSGKIAANRVEDLPASPGRTPLAPTFTVRVQDKGGLPIEGARVVIWGQSGMKLNEQTDHTGVLSLPILSAYPGTLRVARAGFTPETRTLIQGRMTYVVPLFSRRTLIGQVFDENGNGLAGVRLRLTPAYSNASSAAECVFVTKGDGRFRFSGLANEGYAIEVYSDSHAPRRGPKFSFGKDDDGFLIIHMRRFQAIILAYENSVTSRLPHQRLLEVESEWASQGWMAWHEDWMARLLLRGVRYDDLKIGWVGTKRRTARVSIKVHGFEPITGEFKVSSFGEGGQIRVNTCALKPLPGWMHRTVIVMDKDSKRPVEGNVPLGITTLDGKDVVGYQLKLQGKAESILLPNGKFRFLLGKTTSGSFLNSFKQEVTSANDVLRFSISLGGTLRIATQSVDPAHWVKIRRLRRANKPLRYNRNGWQARSGEPLVLEWMSPGDYDLTLIDQDGMTVSRSIRIQLGKTTVVEF